MRFTRNRRNRAVSPTTATVLLVVIAITIVIIYAVVTGHLGVPASQVQFSENLTITSGQVTDNTHITIYIKNSGTTAITLSSVFVDGINVSAEFVTNPLPAGETIPVILNDPAAMWLNSSHTIEVVASDGTSAEYVVK